MKESKYLTSAVVTWDCKRCRQDVLLINGKPQCGCNYENSTVTYETEDGVLELSIAASPWRAKECLNGNGSNEFVLFRR